MKSKMDEKKACGLHCTKINNISVKFGNDVILKNVSIHIHCGELTDYNRKKWCREKYIIKSNIR